MSNLALLAYAAEKADVAFEGLWCAGQLSACDIARLPALGAGIVIHRAPPIAAKVLAGKAQQVTAVRRARCAGSRQDDGR